MVLGLEFEAKGQDALKYEAQAWHSATALRATLSSQQGVATPDQTQHEPKVKPTCGNYLSLFLDLKFT